MLLVASPGAGTEDACNYMLKSFLVVGSLQEFVAFRFRRSAHRFFCATLTARRGAAATMRRGRDTAGTHDSQAGEVAQESMAFDFDCVQARRSTGAGQGARSERGHRPRPEGIRARTSPGCQRWYRDHAHPRLRHRYRQGVGLQLGGMQRDAAHALAREGADYGSDETPP